MTIRLNSAKDTADVLMQAAISFVPVKTDGTKAAAVEWKQYQERLPTGDEVRHWFANGAMRGIATICGDVSGGLEVVDLDATDLREEFEELIKAELPEVFPRLLIVQTPKDGRHYVFRSTATEKNQKLARRQDSSVMIETRGEGGYVLAPGCPLECHPSRRPYVIIQGDYLHLPQLTKAERASLFDCARHFNLLVEVAQDSHPLPRPSDGPRPGDDFNAKADSSTVGEMLTNAGWTKINRRSKYGQMWRRPGKNDVGASATLADNGALRVFSTNAWPFESDKTYSPFAVLTLTQFNGDFSACTKALAAQGYGQKKTEVAKKRDEAKAEPQLFAPSETLIRPDELTVMGLASRFHERFRENTRYVLERNGFFNYAYGLWTMDICAAEHKTQTIINEVHDQIAETEAKIEKMKAQFDAGDVSIREQLVKTSLFLDALYKFVKKIKIPGTMGQILHFSRSQLRIEADRFDAIHDLLNVQNGAVELNTGNHRPHKPDDFCSMSSPVKYDKSAKCPRWEKFLEEIFLEKGELIAFMKRAIGYSISGYTSEQVFLILHGDGSNGKSELLWVLEQLLGSYLKSANIDTFMDDRSSGGHNEDIARLRGARLVTTSETEKSRKVAEALVKRVTGEDVIVASFKHERSFEFRPRFKIWMAANHKPIISGTDYGIWRRILLVPFLAKFVKPGNDLNATTFLIDTQLRKELAKELPGILNWAIEGYIEWRRDGLNPPEIVRAATKEYEEESDKLGLFLIEEMILGDGFNCPISSAYEAYKRWAEAGGMRPSNIRSFSADVKQRGIEVKRMGHGNVTTMVGYALLAK